MTTHLAPLWISDPAWQAMDATARGMHAQLVLLAARRKPAGTLPDDDLLWRRWLGLPLRLSAVKEAHLSKAWDKTLSPQGLPAIVPALLSQIQETQNAPQDLDPDSLTCWLWEHRWKPMILGAWERIDDAHVERDPRMENVLGGWFNPISHHLAREQAGEMLPVLSTPRKPRKGVRADVTTWNQQVGHDGDAANLGLAHLQITSSPWRDPASVLVRWRAEVDDTAKKTMWDVGISCLAGSHASDSEKSKARGILGKHIKQYGEKAVAQAVGVMAMRSIPPADAVSFLQGLLRQEDEGTPAMQAARQKRANLCL